MDAQVLHTPDLSKERRRSEKAALDAYVRHRLQFCPYRTRLFVWAMLFSIFALGL
jgi:hypothetical protein